MFVNTLSGALPSNNTPTPMNTENTNGSIFNDYQPFYDFNTRRCPALRQYEIEDRYRRPRYHRTNSARRYIFYQNQLIKCILNKRKHIPDSLIKFLRMSSPFQGIHPSITV